MPGYQTIHVTRPTRIPLTINKYSMFTSLRKLLITSLLPANPRTDIDFSHHSSMLSPHVKRHPHIRAKPPDDAR